MPKKYQDVPPVEQEFTLIINKESKLPKRLRDFILDYFEVQESEQVDGEQ